MSANPNLTPPATKTKNDAPRPVTSAVVPPTEKAPKVAKAPKVIDPNAPKKERAARKDLGIGKESVITVTDMAKEAKVRGKRLEYRDLLVKFDGKKVGEFVEATKVKDTGKGGSGASWMRWFVDEGYATVTRVEKPVAAPAVEAPKV